MRFIKCSVGIFYFGLSTDALSFHHIHMVYKSGTRQTLPIAHPTSLGQVVKLRIKVISLRLSATD